MWALWRADIAPRSTVWVLVNCASYHTEASHEPLAGTVGASPVQQKATGLTRLHMWPAAVRALGKSVQL